MSQIDSKKQYHLDVAKIKSGEDGRTTLMIKNIPNNQAKSIILLIINTIVCYD